MTMERHHENIKYWVKGNSGSSTAGNFHAIVYEWVDGWKELTTYFFPNDKFEFVEWVNRNVNSIQYSFEEK